MPDDHVSSLLQRYAEYGCDASFATLVSRYHHLVHGAALQRLNGNAAMADDVVQRVFIQLASRAHSIDASQGLGGWLCHCAIHSAADLQRSESRRRARELIAAAHESLKRTNFLEAITNGEVNALGLKLELAPDTKDAVFNALSAINREDRFADHSSLQNLSDLEAFADHDIARRRDAFASILGPDQLQSWESEAAAWRQATLERFGYRTSETAAATSRPDGSS